MKPSKKSPQIETFLEMLSDRTSAITENKCVDPPIGCGEPIVGFRDKISLKEYTISGLCQKCQDKFFI